MKLNSSMLLRTALCLSALLALSARAETVSLSGTVYDASGNNLFGVAVSLATGGLSTITNASGTWKLSGTTMGIQNRNTPLQSITTHLFVQNDHVLLNYRGNDLLGRSRQVIGVDATSGSTALSRSFAAITDTLLFSWKNSVLVRIPLTSYVQSDLATIIDTSLSGSSGNEDSGTFTDSRDKQIYMYVKIGTQTWMAQNLNYAGVTRKIGVCYENMSSNCTAHGHLYSWPEVMAGSLSSTANPSGVQGVCPNNWHVPSDAEWSTLVQYVDSATSGTKLKSTSGWSRLGKGTDSYGFTATPGGLRIADEKTFISLDTYAIFWSSSEASSSAAWYRSISNDDAYVSRDSYDKTLDFSIRCIKNQR